MSWPVTTVPLASTRAGTPAAVMMPMEDHLLPDENKIITAVREVLGLAAAAR